MKRISKSILAALLLIVMFSLPALAAVAAGQGTQYGPSADVSQRETADWSTGTGAKKCTDAAGNTYYLFDGRKYAVEKYWGQHYLTGFSAGETGSRKTASGALVRENYTAASTRENLGRVILVNAVSGGKSDRNIHRYDGVYKCQDTGGPAVETGTANTMNMPVVDLYFEDLADALRVTDYGWITADIYILREIE